MGEKKIWVYVHRIVNIVTVLLFILFIYLISTIIFGHSATNLQIFISVGSIFFTSIVGLYVYIHKIDKKLSKGILVVDKRLSHLMHQLDKKVDKLEIHQEYVRKDIEEIKLSLANIEQKLA